MQNHAFSLFFPLTQNMPPVTATDVLQFVFKSVATYIIKAHYHTILVNLVEVSYVDI